MAAMTCCETPVAPTGWPLALSPPERLTGSLPSWKTQPSSMARAPWPRFGEPHDLVHDQLGDGEAVVHLGEVQVLEPDAGHPQRALPGARVAAKAVGSRRSAGKKSFAWPKPASRTGAVAPPVGATLSTTAAAPSDTGEQSVRRSGSATIGFLSETVRQNSSPRSLRSWA